MTMNYFYRFPLTLVIAVYEQINTRMAVSPTSEGSPQAVLVHVAQNTTLHGVPNAYNARSWIRKAIWSILFLASCGKFDWIAVIYVVRQEVNFYFPWRTRKFSDWWHCIEWGVVVSYFNNVCHSYSIIVMSNERHDVSNHRQLDYLSNGLFRLTSKTPSKLYITVPLRCGWWIFLTNDQ